MDDRNGTSAIVTANLLFQMGRAFRNYNNGSTYYLGADGAMQTNVVMGLGNSGELRPSVKNRGGPCALPFPRVCCHQFAIKTVFFRVSPCFFMFLKMGKEKP